MSNVPVHFLKARYEGITSVLFAEVMVGPAFEIDDAEHPPQTEKFRAIWDTGASATVITQSVVDRFELKPIDLVLTHHAQGQAMAEVYLISLAFPNSFGLGSLRVTKGILGGFDVLIGMDLIQLGDFAVSNQHGRTELTFQMPSQGLAVLAKKDADISKKMPAAAPKPPPFVIEGKAVPATSKPTPFVAAPKIGRNEPCQCGSGKKYKHCCGK